MGAAAARLACPTAGDRLGPLCCAAECVCVNAALSTTSACLTSETVGVDGTCPRRWSGGTQSAQLPSTQAGWRRDLEMGTSDIDLDHLVLQMNKQRGGGSAALSEPMVIEVPGSVVPGERKRAVASKPANRTSARNNGRKLQNLLGLESTKSLALAGSFVIADSSAGVMEARLDAPKAIREGIAAWQEAFGDTSGDAWQLDSSGDLNTAEVEDGSLGLNTFPPWSDALARKLRSDRRMASWVLRPRTVLIFLGGSDMDLPLSVWREASGLSAQALTSTVSHDAQDACISGSTQENANVTLSYEARSSLEEVALRPRPMELMLLALAFAYLGRTSVPRWSARAQQTINTRHPSVETFFLKYTCLKSRCTLREELAKWCPPPRTSQPEHATCNTLKRPGRLPLATVSEEGPDDFGPAVDFEVFAAFVDVHATPRQVLDDAFSTALPQTCTGSESPCRQNVQTTLEITLGPLLAGSLETVGANDTGHLARQSQQVAVSAAALALSAVWPPGSDKLPPGHLAVPWTPPDTRKLHDRAAALARMHVMHLSGDVFRWRACGTCL